MSAKLGDIYKETTNNSATDEQQYWIELYNEIKVILNCMYGTKDHEEVLKAVTKVLRPANAANFCNYRAVAHRSSDDVEMCKKWHDWAINQNLFAVVNTWKWSGISGITTYYGVFFFFEKENAEKVISSGVLNNAILSNVGHRTVLEEYCVL
jgi:hypothetical protein